MSEDTENTQDGYWEGLLKVERKEINAELDLKIVAKHLEYAREYNLEPEVVWSAIRYAQANPKAEMLEVMYYGCGDWDVSP
jgi:hypothetical protein